MDPVMNDDLSTLESQSSPNGSARAAERARPGLIVLYSNHQPCAQVLELEDSRLTLGRSAAGFDDRRMSRQHAHVRYRSGSFFIRDLDSQNGTYLNGKRCTSEVAARAGQVLRVGDTLLLLCPDVHSYQRHGVRVADGRVTGPQCAEAMAAIAGHAQTSTVLHIHGESGTGKEEAARVFHAHGPGPTGPFIAVNCAAVPEGIAERLLFGAVRGAYSGAEREAAGYLAAAHGGTLFLDEVAELDLAVQAKLLRALELREVLPLGAVRARPLELRLCTATHHELRTLASSGQLRPDLYFRIGTPQVRLPPLRERPTDIPFLIGEEMARVASLRVHASFVEECLLRHWPGNIRELLAAVRTAAQKALGAAAARLDARHLDPRDGVALTAGPCKQPELDSPPPPESEAGEIRAAALREALRKSRGNVTAAAVALGIHRTQLRRWLRRYGVNANQLE